MHGFMSHVINCAACFVMSHPQMIAAALLPMYVPISATSFGALRLEARNRLRALPTVILPELLR